MLNIPMHRFKYTKLTKAQIGKKLKATDSGPECRSGLSDVLAGKSLKIVTHDGPILEYTFRNKNSLTLSENGGRRVRAGYGALPLRQIVFFSHMIPNTQKGYHVFVDRVALSWSVFWMDRESLGKCARVLATVEVETAVRLRFTASAINNARFGTVV